jgi:hypothetical protein
VGTIPYADVARQTASDVRDLALRVLDIEAHPSGPGEQGCACSGELDPAAVLLKQSCAAILFQTMDAAGQRWLGSMELLRRVAEMLERGDRLEVAEVAEVHTPSPVYLSEEIIDWTIWVAKEILLPMGRPQSAGEPDQMETKT